LRNFVVADVSLTNGKEIEFKPKRKEEIKEDAIKETHEVFNPVESTILQKMVRFISKLRLNERILKAIVGIALLFVLYSLKKHGVLNLFGQKILQNRAFKFLMLVLFNYKINGNK